MIHRHLSRTIWITVFSRNSYHLLRAELNNYTVISDGYSVCCTLEARIALLPNTTFSSDHAKRDESRYGINRIRWYPSCALTGLSARALSWLRSRRNFFEQPTNTHARKFARRDFETACNTAQNPISPMQHRRSGTPWQTNHRFIIVPAQK